MSAHTRAFVPARAVQGNLLIDKNLTVVKISDFDCARGAGMVVPSVNMTPEYTSPEAAAAFFNHAPLTAAASHDMFCAGLVLWTLMDEGHGPAFLDPANARELLLGSADPVVDPALLHFKSATLQALMARLLAREPRRRPTAAEVLADGVFATHGAHTLEQHLIGEARLMREGLEEVSLASVRVSGTCILVPFVLVKELSCLLTLLL